MARILAIDANTYIVRMAMVEPDGYLHGGIDVKPNNVDKLLMFIRSQAIQSNHYISIAGSPMDRWPSHLRQLLENEVGSRVDWISPEFLRHTSTELARWQHQRKFDRARLLALASASRDRQAIEPHSILRQWQRMLIDEMSQRLSDISPMDER